MKPRIILSIVISSLLSSAVASAQFSVSLKDNSRVLTSDGRFEATEQVSSGYSFAGIDVGEIGSITLSTLPQDEAGTQIPALPEAEKQVVILDLSERNGEDEKATRNLYSSEYMLEVAGLPYFITSSLDEALASASMLLLSSPIVTGEKATLSPDEWNRVAEWVCAGGILVSPAITDTLTPELAELFGISSRTRSQRTRYYLYWTSESHPELVYIDEPEEKETRIGAVSSSVLTPSTATPLAFYDKGSESVAVVKNKLGKGAAYLFGFSWREVIQRSQLNKDSGGSRGVNNSFEPSADMVPLFIRAAHAASQPVTAWKFTVPDGYSSVLIPTHDCDSRTALDSMAYLADYEKSLGLRAHYFITVHYFRQPGYLSAFYNEETVPLIGRLTGQGHTVGSHSVCHYPDFSDTARFPLTEYSEEEYASIATHDLATGKSVGSTWAELVLSKRILERDLSTPVRSFRSGHLCVNNNIPAASRIAGYDFSSCYTASDLMSQFPFIERMGNDWSGEPSGTLQIPLHFSDVFSVDKMTEDNWHEKPEIWFGIFNKLKGNYASSVILIHPNRKWKMSAQKMLVDMLDSRECGLFNFEDYGDFWLKRRDFRFTLHHDVERGKVIVRATAADIAANPHLGIVIEHGAGAPAPENITLVDETGRVHPVCIRKLAEGRYIMLL